MNFAPAHLANFNSIDEVAEAKAELEPALLRAFGLTDRGHEVVARLRASVRAFPAACSACGAGLLDANGAVLLAKQTSTMAAVTINLTVRAGSST